MLFEDTVVGEAVDEPGDVQDIAFCRVVTAPNGCFVVVHHLTLSPIAAQMPRLRPYRPSPAVG
jgi:hypothetical protein